MYLPTRNDYFFHYRKPKLGVRLNFHESVTRGDEATSELSFELYVLGFLGCPELRNLGLSMF